MTRPSALSVHRSFARSRAAAPLGAASSCQFKAVDRVFYDAEAGLVYGRVRSGDDTYTSVAFAAKPSDGGCLDPARSWSGGGDGRPPVGRRRGARNPPQAQPDPVQQVMKSVIIALCATAASAFVAPSVAPATVACQANLDAQIRRPNSTRARHGLENAALAPFSRA